MAAGAALFLALTAVIVFGPLWAQAALDFLNAEPAEVAFWSRARFAFAFATLIIALFAAHMMLPAASPKGPVAPGVFFTATAWLAAAGGFSVYVAYAPSYSITYGALGGVILTLLFFYASAMIFIFGAELNAELAGAQIGAESQNRLRTDAPGMEEVK